MKCEIVSVGENVDYPCAGEAVGVVHGSSTPTLVCADCAIGMLCEGFDVVAIANQPGEVANKLIRELDVLCERFDGAAKKHASQGSEEFAAAIRGCRNNVIKILASYRKEGA